MYNFQLNANYQIKFYRVLKIIRYMIPLHRGIVSQRHFPGLVLADASSSNEAVHLQQRLRSLSTELVTLRNRLHVSQPTSASGPANGTSGPLSKSPEKGGAPPSPAPAVPPRTTLPPGSGAPVSHGIGHPAGHTLTASAIVHPHVNHASANALNHNSTTTNNLISG